MIPNYTKFCDGCGVKGTDPVGLHFVDGIERHIHRRGGVNCTHDFCDACELKGAKCECGRPPVAAVEPAGGEWRCRSCRGTVEKNLDHVEGCALSGCTGTFSHVRTTRHNIRPCNAALLDVSHGGVILVL